MTRTSAIRVLAVDGAQCKGNICFWSATRYPGLITISPIGHSEKTIKFIWSVELLSSEIQEIDDLRARIMEHEA